MLAILSFQEIMRNTEQSHPDWTNLDRSGLTAYEPPSSSPGSKTRFAAEQALTARLASAMRTARLWGSARRTLRAVQGAEEGGSKGQKCLCSSEVNVPGNARQQCRGARNDAPPGTAGTPAAFRRRDFGIGLLLLQGRESGGRY